MARPRQTPISKTEKLLMIYNEVKGQIKDIEIMITEEVGLRSRKIEEPSGRVSARSISRPTEHEGIKRAELISLMVDKEFFIKEIDFYLSLLEERERRIIRNVLIDGHRMAEICRGMGITDKQGAAVKNGGLKKLDLHIDDMDPGFIAAAYKSPGGVIY